MKKLIILVMIIGICAIGTSANAFSKTRKLTPKEIKKSIERFEKIKNNGWRAYA